jgi:lysophospholipase L1-like esterase
MLSGGAITVAPARASVVTGATQHFAAKLAGSSDTDVSWTVVESACGTITPKGDYAAPTATATCHVVATSATDPTKNATATVEVYTLSQTTGMPHVSIGKTAFASEGDPTLLTDGAYRNPNAWTFDPSHCSPATPCWAAVKVGAGPSRLLVDWSFEDGQGDFDTLAYGGQTIADYEFFVSPDSTNGADGTWTAATDPLTNHPATVGANTLIHRSALVSFAGDSWIKMAITASTANEIDELDLWDASTTNGDSFFFHGDSITHRCANLRGTEDRWSEQPSFQADVHAAHADHFPLQVGGGISGQHASDAVAEIGTYLTLFRPVKHWFLTMGTNDLCAGADAYAAYAQTWIDAVKAAGAVPILVHPIWGNDNSSYCSDNGPSFNAAVDALVSANGLPPAVPLYEATVGHSEYYDDGDVHPNPTGCAVWNQTFATAVSSFYQ